MTLVSLAKLTQSKTAIVGLSILIVASVLLAWWTISHWSRPPVHTATQALFLGCTDAVQPDDGCHPYRVGGTVVAAPVRSRLPTADFEFELTDGCVDWPVYYGGDAASVSHLGAGDFIVAQGSTSVDGNFYSGTIFVGSEAERLRRDIRQIDHDVPREACPHQQRQARG